jgi:universal stress protein A
MGDEQRELDHLVRGFLRHGIQAEGIYMSGEPIEAILNQAARWEADAIVTGSKGRRGLVRMALGSVAEGLLRRAGSPVLVVKHAASRALLWDRPSGRHES